MGDTERVSRVERARLDAPDSSCSLGQDSAGSDADPGRRSNPDAPSDSRADRLHRLGLSTEVPVGTGNGLNHESVVSCDNIVTIPVRDLGRQIGFLRDDQESALAEAICAAFDLDR